MMLSGRPLIDTYSASAVTKSQYSTQLFSTSYLRKEASKEEKGKIGYSSYKDAHRYSYIPG